MDNAEPSTNGISASNLFRFSSLLASPFMAELGQKTCLAFSTELLQHPFLFSTMLAPIVASNIGGGVVIICGKKTDPLVKQYIARMRAKLLTNTSILFLDPTEKGDDLKWLLEKNPTLAEALKGTETKPRVQVCEGQKCVEPAKPDDLDSLLTEFSHAPTR